MKGIERFKKVAATAQGGVLNGEDVFLLWDTFGFPVDLTELMAQEQGLKVDKQGGSSEQKGGVCPSMGGWVGGYQREGRETCKTCGGSNRRGMILRGISLRLIPPLIGFEKRFEEAREKSKAANKKTAQGALKFEAEATGWLQVR